MSEGFEFMPAQDMAESACPYCGHVIDALTGITGAVLPEPGDATICAYCAGLLVFDAGLVPVEPDEDQLREMLADRELRIAQRAVQQLIRQRR